MVVPVDVVPQVSPVLERLRETRWKYYNLHPIAGDLLGILARLTRAERIVEVGTANGYSAILLGEAVRNSRGRVFTIERNGRLAAEAQRNIAEAGLADVVTVVPGSAYKVLKDLPGPWDFAFLDGTKQEYLGYLDRILLKFAPRAVLVADNLLSHPEELQGFSEAVAADPRFDATVLPIGMGLLVAVYEEAPYFAPGGASRGSPHAAEEPRLRTRAATRSGRALR